MLDRSQEDSDGIKTFKHGRESIGSTDPPQVTSTLGSWASLGRGIGPQRRTSEAHVGLSPDVLQLLSGVAVVELLEQDERPTFIVDLQNDANYNPGTLHFMFTNAALRAYEPVLDMVMGKVALDSPGVIVNNTFPEFKAWVLSFVRNHESLDVYLPSFLYGGMTWTCSTLQKRLRVISSSNRILPKIGAPSSADDNGVLSNRPRGRTYVGNSSNKVPEPPDYFGNVEHIRNESTGQPVLVTSHFIESPTYVEASSGAFYANANRPALRETAMVHDGSVSMSLISQDFSRDTKQSPATNLLSVDWTRTPISPALPKHVQFARSIDWASTSLGRIEDWSYDLRATANLIFSCPFPCAMYWGDEYVIIYNEAYVPLAGEKHPAMMGMNYEVVWQEIWDKGISEVFENARNSGQATMRDDDLLFLRRYDLGVLEECYFSWSIVPLVGENGQVVGLMNPAFEKTRRKIAERRMLTLREVGEKVATAREVKGFWNQVIKGLEYNEYDVPFVFLFSVTDESESEMGSMHSGSASQYPQAILEGTLGVPASHSAANTRLDLRTSDIGWSRYLREAMKSDGPVLISTDNGNLSELIVGLDCRGFPDPCRNAVVCPIHPTTGDSLLGFLVIGVNPRRPYDDDYNLFIQILCRQLATSMASVVLFEEEIERGQRAARLAALDRIELSKQLDLRTQEVVESETKFTRMAEFAPVGIFTADSCGQITYSNDTWWEIISPREDRLRYNWMDSIKDDDRIVVQMVWDKLIAEKIPITQEFRVKSPWQDKNGMNGETWVLMSAHPEKDAEGGLKSVFGSLTDISQQKWAEDVQKRRMEEAFELKRQQENFIDITSHEMRNPLSAILQCADDISTSLSGYQAEGLQTSMAPAIIIENCIDAANTIVLCAQHQKRIVDDVLTLSKLDSALLLVTPVDVQPVAVVQRALKMFKGEVERNDINLDFLIEKSYQDFQVDWVKLDPSRLLQVLINLTTNAIKFTQTQDKRTIVVSIGASLERPSSVARGFTSNDAGNQSITYFPTRSKRHNLMGDKEWGTGKEIYLHFTVNDTGQGLDEDEKKVLFLRFSQASPRTHIQYGGSGLGLFISRELTELQGGEIGVSSARGVGSTFTFYIKARASTAPSMASYPTLPILRQNSPGQSFSSVTENRRIASASIKSTVAHPAPQMSSNKSFAGRSMLNVLIVEDNLVNQRVLQKQLHNNGFRTEVANHGGEALEILKKSNYWSGNREIGQELFVILMDLEMPVMDGLTCVRKIRELEAENTIVRHVPVIAVTANARLEQVEAALAAGMDYVVSKPFRIAELIPKIEELVQKREKDGRII